MITLVGKPRTAGPKSQADQILDHMIAIGPITPLEALNLYGCMRLGARIYDLERRGVDIVHGSYKTPSGKLVAQYSLRFMRAADPSFSTADWGQPNG